MIGFTFDQVRGFVAVAEELHFGRAAERLRMTQPPLSRSLQKLERALDAPLIERRARGIALTPAGTAFLGEARRLLAAAERAQDATRRAAAGDEGTLSLGFTATAGADMLPGVLTEIDDLLPGVDVHVRELVTAAQLEAVADGALDLALVRRAPLTPGMAVRLVHEEPLVVAVPAPHPLATVGDVLAPADLAGAELIGYDPVDAQVLAALVARTLDDAPVPARRHVAQVHTMLALVAAGRGIALVPASAARLPRPGVAVRALPADAPRLPLFAVWDSANPNPVLPRVLTGISALRAR